MEKDDFLLKALGPVVIVLGLTVASASEAGFLNADRAEAIASELKKLASLIEAIGPSDEEPDPIATALHALAQQVQNRSR
jgi:hypothetical protein